VSEPEFRKISPRPLGLHLAAATAGLTGAAAAAPLAANGGLIWHPSLADEAASFQAAVSEVEAGEFTRAVWAEVSQGIESMLQGIRLYQNHDAVRPPSPAVVAWTEDAARLLDFGGGGSPILMVPSLVNSSDVLDLDEEGSLARWLAGQGGLRPFLMDWGRPGEQERSYGLSAYVSGPLKSALDHVSNLAGGPVPVIGYCMGGTLSLSAAQLWPDRVRALALLAAPWDFHADVSAPAKLFADSIATWRPVLDAYGEMPVDLIQSFFAALDPGLAQRKFARFAHMDMDSPAARRFVLLEDWLNGGPPLTASVAMDTIGGWFGDNRTGLGRWLVGGQVIDPARVACPSFAAIPANDRIVPPGSARALSDRLQDATVISPKAGHIGMVVGGRARQSLWEPLGQWLTTHR